MNDLHVLLLGIWTEFALLHPVSSDQVRAPPQTHTHTHASKSLDAAVTIDLST